MKALTLQKKSITIAVCMFIMAMTGLFVFDGTTNESLALTTPDCRVCHTNAYPRHHAIIRACAACHRTGSTPRLDGTDPNHPDRNCLTCHYPGTIVYRAIDVTTAHSPLHDKTDVPDPATCNISCHLPGVIDEHTKYPAFDAPSGEMDCDRCHLNTNTDPQMGPINVQETIALGSGGAAGQIVTCDQCHTNITGEGHAAAHDNVFPDSIDCTSINCHAANVMTEHTNRGWTCGTCHNGATLTLDPVLVQQVVADATGPFNPATSAYCTDCHGADAGTHMAAHNQGFFLATPAPQDCTRCHAAMNPGVDPNMTDLVTEHVTNREFTCATCHDKTDHIFDAINKGRTPSNQPVYCIDCHTDATSGQGKGHAPISVDAEPWSECNWCHTLDIFDYPEHTIHRAAAQDMLQDCSVCHVPEGIRPDCILCHSLEQTIWDPLPVHRTAPNTSLNIIGPGTEDHDKHTGIDCSFCHINGAPGSDPLPAPYNECSRCHSNSGPGTDIAYGSAVHTVNHIEGAKKIGQGCAYCHSQTPACTDCHDIAGPNTPKHDTHTVTFQYNCTECHINGIAGSEPLPEPYNQCAKCHAPTGPGSDIIYGSLIHTNNHIAGGETSGLSCDLCHGIALPAPACVTCHDIAGPLTPNHDFHTGSPRLIDCAECHVSGVPGGTPIPPPYNECSTCHDGTGNTTNINYGQPGHNTHMAQANNNCSRCHTEQPDCSSCHTPGHPPIVAPYNECSTCHDGTGTTTNIMFGQLGHNTHMTAASNDCTVCHTAQPDCSACHTPGHPPITAPYNECSSCHTGILYGQTGHITHVTAASNNCAVCHTAQPDCSACHAPSHPPVPVPYNECDQCHLTLQPGQVTHDLHRTRAVQDCTVCHTAQPDCSLCHVPSHPPVPAPYNECDQCHDTLQPGQATHDAHRVQANQNCAACHTAQPDCSACHAPSHPAIPAPYNECDQCHTTLQPGQVTHDTHRVQANQDCTTCHNAQPDCSACHVPSHPAIPAPYNECDQCHTTLQPGQVTHDTHRLQASQDCTVCHTAQPNCAQCHTGDANHNAAHDNAGVPSAGCTKCHDANVVIEHVDNRGFTCATCHDSTDPNVSGAIDDGKAGTFVTCYDCHGQNNHHATAEAKTGNCTYCHADPRPLDNDPKQLACRQCHIDNNGFVKTGAGKPSHAFNTQAKIQDFGACFDCHAPVPYHAKPSTYQQCWKTIPSVTSYYDPTLTPPGKGVFNLFRSEFQKPEKYYDHTSYKDVAKRNCKDNRRNFANPKVSFNWFQMDYQGTSMNVPVFDQGQNVPPHPHSRISAVGNCGDCHTVGTVVAVTHSNNCQACHFSTNQTVQNVISQGRTGTTVDCFSCHGNQGHETAHDMTELTEPNCSECHVGNVFIEHVAKRQLSCTVCHDSTDPNVAGAITNGMKGAPVPCQDCHGANAGNHEAAHDNAGVPSTGCTSCHDANVVVEHVTNRAFTCATCHDNTTSNVINAINSGKAGTFVSCNNCHTQGGGSAHHDNDNARTGNCSYCHADPRLDINPKAPTGQLACRQCHVDNNGFVKTSAGKPSHAFNTQGTIQDFGACFDCHQPTPYHAKPTAWPGWYGENKTAPGRGTFNLFYNGLRPSCAGDCENTLEKRSGYGEGSQPERDQGRNWRNPSISFTMVTSYDYFNTKTQRTVPTFGPGGGTPPPPPQQDFITITRAEYKDKRLEVYAENTMKNNVALTLAYEGRTYQMSWNKDKNRWEIRISDDRCSNSTINVTSSAGGSASKSVSGCSG